MGANLRGADFSRTNLTNAKLDYACVDDADFTGANLEFVDRQHTNLSKAIMNGVAQMQSSTSCPIMYSRNEKYREETISEICNLIKNSYKKIS
ncbi:MAG: pentapeptide repeat-containing protein [Symbiopectobacterium sp.]|uniref:pentapeptide repeat-containing protein n=1 Tax=Symbiopectobacterium sp. TaxID=2952789 RepID=UPI0039E7BE22